jgi:hypothetical protein
MQRFTKGKEMHSSEENGDTASLSNDIWDVMHYKTDKKGRTNWLKIGRAWAKPENDNITMKLFALPIPNAEGEVILNLVYNEALRPKP